MGFRRSNGVLNFVVYRNVYPERPLNEVRRRILLAVDFELLESDARAESLELDEEADLCLCSASARMSSRLTLRSEELVTMESICSVNLEAVMMNDGGSCVRDW